MKKITEDLKMQIAALLIMDGVTWRDANRMQEQMDQEAMRTMFDDGVYALEDSPRALLLHQNAMAIFETMPLLDHYYDAEEDMGAGVEPYWYDKEIKEEIDTIINGIKTKEQDPETTDNDNEEGTTMTNEMKKVYMGTLNRELQKLNDQLTKTYGNGYVTIHDGATYDDIVACEVSWASIGDVTPEEATGFAGQLMTAIAMAKSFIFNGWEVTFDKNEDEGEAHAAREKAKTTLDNWDGAEADPYYLLKYVDYDELTDEQQALIDEYDARHEEELAAAALEDDDYIELQEDEYADEWAPAPAWADYDTIDEIAMMMMNDGEPAWRLRDRAAELQAWYDGAVEAAVMLGTTPPARVLTIMRNCHTLREAAAIIDMHAPIVPTITPEDALDVILPY